MHSPIRVQISDLQGREVQRLDTCEAFVELALPPGTYDVTVTLGDIRLRYTIALAPGTSCDLHPRFAPAANG